MSAESKGPEKLPAYTDHDGFLMPKGFPPEGFRSGLSYEAQGENDAVFHGACIAFGACIVDKVGTALHLLTFSLHFHLQPMICLS